MSRPKALRPKRRARVDIYEDIYTRLELLHYDPLRGKMRYGSLSSLVNHLLEEHLASFKTPETDPTNGIDNSHPE